MLAIKTSGGCLPSNEDALLLAACLFEPKEAIEAWKQWKQHQSLDSAERNLYRLFPLLYGNLQRAGYTGDDLPLLMKIYRRNREHNQKLFHDAEIVLKQFRTAGIPALLLKGLALSQIYYPDIYARHMDDGDILVPIEHTDAAIALLQNMGWRLDIALKKKYKHTSHAATFVNDNGNKIDLHWHVLYDSPKENVDIILWHRAIPIKFLSENTLTLSATDHLLHSCIHGYLWNYMPPLRWIADSYLILRQSGQTIEWDYLIQQARQQNFSLRLSKSLNYLKTQWNLPIPIEAIKGLQAVPASDFEQYEHDILTQLDRPQNYMLRAIKQIIWELKKTWCLQHRLYPKQSSVQRILGFPAMLCNEMRLDSVWQIPVAALKHLQRKPQIRAIKAL